MAFTVKDLSDLIALLEQHPEWKERLRQVLFTEDLLRLPSAINRLLSSVDRLTEAVERLIQWHQEAVQWQREVNEQLRQLLEWQRETTQWQREVNEQLRQLLEWQQEMIQWQRETTQWQQQVNEQLRELSEQMRRVWESLQEVIKWQQEMVKWQQEMVEWQKRADKDFAKLKGSDREWFYRLRAASVFGIFVLNGRDPTNEVMRKLHEAVKEGVLTRSELKAVRDADCLWLGEYEGKPVLLVVEASYTVSHEDLVRAVHRAEIARKIGYCAVPVVGGAEVPDEIWDQARLFNTIVMCDGEADFDFAEQVIRQAVGL